MLWCYHLSKVKEIMSPLGIVLLSVGILGLVIVFYIGLSLVVARMLRRQIAETTADWQAAGVQIVKGPATGNYRGHLSAAVPVKGVGVLALTDRDLRFVRLKPRQEFVIPLAHITHLVVKRVWKGSYRGGLPVIGVYFDDGVQADAMGVIVARQDQPAWIDAITQAAGVEVKES
jgi:hypothetical protein